MITTINYPDKNKKKFIKSINKIKKTIKEDIDWAMEQSRLIARWQEVMACCGLYNFKKDTFGLREIQKKDYGYTCRIKIVDGFNFEDLEKKKTTIEDNLPCLLQMKKNPIDNFISAKIITRPIKDILFNPPSTNPWEVYIGTGIDTQPIVIDMNEYPHLMDSGATGTGKSRLLDIALTTLIHNHTKEEIGLFLIQVEKNDLFMYEHCEQVRFITNKLEKAKIALQYLSELVVFRNRIFLPFKQKGMFSDIRGYNKHFPKNKMSVIYVVIDEFAGIMPQNFEDDDTKNLKKTIIGLLEQISRLGRSCGIFLLSGLQRATADNYPPFIKSQINVNISFRQNNPKSSEVATGDTTLALKLPKREAVCITDDVIYLKTPFIDDKTILKYINNNINFHITKLFDDENSTYGKDDEEKKKKGKTKKNNDKIELKKHSDNEEVISVNTNSTNNENGENQNSWSIPKNQVINNKLPSTQSFDRVAPKELNKATIIENNIKNIPNFVPYVPLSDNVKIIDETKFNPSKTQKPIKIIKGGND